MAHHPSSVTAQQPRISFEAFLEQYAGTRAEWDDGQVITLSPVSAEHQRIGRLLFGLLAAYLEAHGLGEVFYEAFHMKTAPGLPGREPDMLVVLNEHGERIKDTHLAGPADMVVEIVSPESRYRDGVQKFREYEQGGVGEYWLIDPGEQTAHFYVRQGDGRFELAAVEADGRYHARVVPGFWIRERWLWERPQLSEARRELGC